MGNSSTKKREQYNEKIIQASSGLLNQEILDYIYMNYNFNEDELLTLVDAYKKLCGTSNNLISPTKLMEYPPFHFSPFGYHKKNIKKIKKK